MLTTLPQPIAGGNAAVDAAGADPSRYNVELPFGSTFYPAGHALEVSSNSADVLSTAAKLWQRYPALSNAPPLRLRIIDAGSHPACARQRLPPCGEGHLFSVIHSEHDFALADLSTGFAFATLSRETLADHDHFAYYFLEPLVYAMLGARHFVFVHASCISRNGRAILLCGDSGSGKTCLAYACAKLGWDYVAGDALHVLRGHDNRTVIGRPYEIRFRESARRLFPELSRFRPAIRPNGRADLEIDTAELDIPVAPRSSARHIVFIEPADVTRLEKYSGEQAMHALEKTICYGNDQMRAEQRETLLCFTELPVWRLRYSGPDQAERALGLLLDDD
jgi:hypothetical protein